MNIRKIKLALTVGLMNTQSGNALQNLKEMMQNFGEEVGNFLGLEELGRRILTPNNIERTYAIQFERCTLDVDLVSNPRTKTQVVRSFNLR